MYWNICCQVGLEQPFLVHGNFVHFFNDVPHLLQNPSHWSSYIPPGKMWVRLQGAIGSSEQFFAHRRHLQPLWPDQNHTVVWRFGLHMQFLFQNLDIKREGEKHLDPLKVHSAYLRDLLGPVYQTGTQSWVLGCSRLWPSTGSLSVSGCVHKLSSHLAGSPSYYIWHPSHPTTPGSLECKIKLQ